eukprot:3400531-Amphidinium_carterae.1
MLPAWVLGCCGSILRGVTNGLVEAPLSFFDAAVPTRPLTLTKRLMYWSACHVGDLYLPTSSSRNS